MSVIVLIMNEANYVQIFKLSFKTLNNKNIWSFQKKYFQFGVTSHNSLS